VVDGLVQPAYVFSDADFHLDVDRRPAFCG